MKEEQKKFYQTEWFSIICLVIFSPIGIIILWANGNFSVKKRIGISLFSLIFLTPFQANFYSGNDGTANTYTLKKELKEEIKAELSEELADMYGLKPVQRVADKKEETKPADKAEAKPDTKDDNKSDKKEEVKENNEVVTKEEPQAKKEVVTTKVLTSDEFNSTYKIDQRDKQYPNGTFILKNGQTVQAHYFSYIGGHTFEYGSVIFKDEKIAHMQLALMEGVAKEQVLAEFGFSDKDVTYTFNERTNVAEINVDPTFSDENIHRFPFELD